MYIDRDYTINAELLNELIDKHEEKIERLQGLEDYYLGTHNAIDKRYDGYEYISKNKVVINHAKYITDIATGYLMGKKIDYNSEYDLDPVLEKYNKQSINDLDLQIATTCSYAGKSLDYTYVNEEGNIKTTQIDITSGFVVYDDTVDHNKLFGLMYEEVEGTYEITLADDMSIFDIKLKGNDITIEITPHFLGDVPFVEYHNNPNSQGDFEQVMSLIDAYDFLQSDRVNDKEQLVNAILVIMGSTMDEETIEKLKKYRMMFLSNDEKAEYLTKGLNETDVEVLKKSLEADIHKISMVPNMSDENFANNLSGVAMKYKLLAFEQMTIKKERYFEKGLLERFALYNYYLNIKENMPIVPIEDINVIFTRNLPINDLEIADMIVRLDGKVDDETLIGRLSFIDDASAIIERVEEKKAQNMENYLGNFGEVEETSEEE